ncbi:MAG: hypothetical protein K6U14_10720 [Firmicutes bacterium]|nr:phenylacetate--CoA ligase family protein [Alicyclobacillaceae bacterium]MCL6498084.1 hypothetical protein [Bacillota bacterium]
MAEAAMAWETWQATVGGRLWPAAARDGMDRTAASAVDPAAVPGVRVVRSAGRQGAPLWWVRSAADCERETVLWGRALANVGVRPQDRVLVATGHPDWDRAVLEGVAASGAKGMAANGVLGQSGLDPYRPFRPTVLVTQPRMALALARAGQLSGLGRLVLWGDIGRGVVEARKDLLPPELAVAEVYALTEHPGPLAVECPAGRLHWLAEGVALEWMDPWRREPAAEGRIAEVWVTDLTARALPLYRYRTGDLVELPKEPCPCGAEGWSTSRLRGRLAQTRWLGRRPVLPAVLAESVLASPGIGEWEVAFRWDRSRGRDLLEVTLAVEPGHDPDAVQQAVQARAEEVTGWLTVRVEVVAPAAVPFHSRFQFYDRRPVGGAAARGA